MLRVLYLCFYNLFGLCGWAMILFQVVSILLEGRVTNLWKELEGTVKLVQGAAVLEIMHSLLGLVRSPVSRTFVQVTSRLLTVWASMDPLYTYPYTPFPKGKGCNYSIDVVECSEEWNYYIGAMTLIAWSFAEIIRYSFYGINTVSPKSVPFVLVWFRYSGFIILYPVGVAGEMLCAYMTLPLLQKGMCPRFEGFLQTCPSYSVTLLYVFLANYVSCEDKACSAVEDGVWGLPWLYTTMLGERKKRLYPKPAPKLQGVVFPVSKNGERSTTNAAKEIFAMAMESTDAKMADKVKKEKNWRFGYTKHILNNLVVSAKSQKHQKLTKVLQGDRDC
ncbi:hypothetical protein GUITHDRAFT_105298 [Guillardia theta CCMP2712]|uniref:very-long-chain (3R)-3-hydroxyacyl-CoA dehydratase n=1 Tax=Guillardia theta (strain CCMP2712) TaxID=905079 RepID=L1JJF8_GUITC|nr:hypothetical protein GUITHDRAFT_105298 [Guillardia theta CCMP2712]EKX48663.1 hypothetical protein GUITHDRAFT_105298 [Guillardia theta CCMP2712]|eukprot:XP_005835643.1 hypothetical protein GUITHDRAFT_105298 [Guillardia theta CCMP2712]